MVAGAAATGEQLECVCCSVRYSARKARIQIRDGSFLYGDICPECVLQEPKGAARRLRIRIAKLTEDGLVELARRGKKDAESLRRLMAGKADALEDADSFPLKVRQAAVRELREKR